MKDYYAILGIAPSAEEVVIRAAWKALSQRYHPDRYVGDVSKANARMVEINEAYSILSDPIRRQTYDKSRSGCEFRSKLDTDSTANWTLIPRQTGQ